MTTMEVVRIDKFGSREVMKFRKVTIPAPGPNEILLKVKAASINPVDWKIREGKYPAVKSDMLPYVLGRARFNDDGAVRRRRANSACAPRYTVQENGEELRDIGSVIEAGKVKPKISKVFDFHEVGSAHEYVEKGDTEGKVVLNVAV